MFRRTRKWLAVAVAVIMTVSMSYVQPAKDVRADSLDASGTEMSHTYVFESSLLEAFAAGSKADGETEKVGTDNYFTIIYSAKSKVDSSNKTWEDGYSSGQRLNLGGVASLSKNSVRFTSAYDNTLVKIWWVEGGDDNRQIAIRDAEGSIAAVTAENAAKNQTVYSELKVDKAGTYYLGGDINNNYIYKLEVTEFCPVEDVPTLVTYTLDAAVDVTPFATAGEKADGDSEKAGTDGFFTVLYSAKSKNDTSKKVFDDGYESSVRINFGDKLSTAKNSIKFTTASDNAEVRVWWACGDVGREIAIIDASGNEIAVTSEGLAKNAIAISKLVIPKAGTYYLGNSPKSNYIFKVAVTQTEMRAPGTDPVKPARADWTGVTGPVITSAVKTKSTVEVRVSMLIGYDGADKVTVAMLDAAGREIASKSSMKEDCSEHCFSFTPSASGDYTFTVTAGREGEEDLRGDEFTVYGFVLPLTAPSPVIDANNGKGNIVISWNATPEAEYYIVTVNGAEVNENTDICAIVDGLKAKISGLSVGSTYEIGVKAARFNGDKSSIGAVASFTATDEAEKTWNFAAFGTSTDTKNNGYIENADGSVTVYSLGGKGKIVPNSTDGLAYYYTTVDAQKENFVISGRIHVDEWTFSNGQEGFGIMAADNIGVHGSTATVWSNSIMAMASKVEYTLDGNKVSMKLGIGSLQRLGVTAADVASFAAEGKFYDANGAATAGTPAGFTSETVALETSCAAKGAGTYNIIGGCTNVDKVTGDCGEADITDLIFEIERNNTGYFVRYKNVNGELLGENKIYDIDRSALASVVDDTVYVGFFAARNAKITVSDISLSTTDPADDAEAETRETVYDVPVNAVIESAANANSADYTLVYYGNADGSLTITDEKGNSIVSGAQVTAGKKYRFNTIISQGISRFTVTFTPDPDYMVDEYTGLASYEPVVFGHSVEFRNYDRVNIYVAPNGSASGDGSKERPLDLASAVLYVAPGQTIVLLEGTYEITGKISVARGIDGTANKPIRMVADPDAASRPVLDFMGIGAGITFAGDYWYIAGFDVTRSANGQKGIQISGNNNTIDNVNAYRNGNTGIQIARGMGTDTMEDWPSNNLVLNCNSYLNADGGYEDADGFAAKLTVAEGNVFDGCISAFNADDGWDLYAKVETGSIGKVVIRNCVAFMNGYDLDENGNLITAGNGNGFKMGGESLSGYHTLINSISFANRAKGIDSNSCPDIQVYNSTAYDNGSYNIAFYTNNAVDTDYAAEGIISYKKSNTTGEQLKLKGSQNESAVYGTTDYYFNGSVSANSEGKSVDDSWFVSLDTDTVINAFKEYIRTGSFDGRGICRNQDNTVNMNGYLELTDAAPQDAGARMTGKASTVIVLEAEPEIPDIPDIRNGFVNILGNTYYFIDDVMQTGWLEIAGGWYWFDTETGIMAKQNKTIGGVYYSFNSDGTVNGGVWKTNIKGTRYYTHGIYAVGLAEIDGTVYYAGDNGYLLKDAEIETERLIYLTDSNGAVIAANNKPEIPENGFYTEFGKTCFYIGGVKASGWTVISGNTYYFDPVTGFMAVTGKTIGGVYYSFRSDGVVSGGVFKDNGKGVRYFIAGSYATGLTEISGNLYYFNESSGYMVKNETVEIGGILYSFASDGTGTVYTEEPVEEAADEGETAEAEEPAEDAEADTEEALETETAEAEETAEEDAEEAAEEAGETAEDTVEEKAEISGGEAEETAEENTEESAGEEEAVEEADEVEASETEDPTEEPIEESEEDPVNAPETEYADIPKDFLMEQDDISDDEI